MEKYIKALEGISYQEWKKLRMGIDRSFELQKGEFEKDLKLDNSDMVMAVMQPNFDIKKLSRKGGQSV